jgi:hypothetical protein
MRRRPLNEREWGRIADRIGNAYRDPFTDDQVQEWLRTFGNEDASLVNEAVTMLLAEYKFFPVQATLWAYIRKAREVREEREEKVRQGGVLSPDEMEKATERGGRWILFIRWMLETGKYPKTREECFSMKAAFEREHPNWKPKPIKMKGTGPTQIGGILKGLNLEKQRTTK